MHVFHCDHCAQLVFFENVQCVQCHRTLAYLPDLGMIGSLDQDGDGLWRSPAPQALEKTYRLCSNYSLQNVCNWAVVADDENEFCLACRLTRLIPDLTLHKAAWFKLEQAKRRLIYTLLKLELPLQNRTEDPFQCLAFEFLADPPVVSEGEGPVLTGHADGVITINVAEADDVERESRRLALHEPYRTLLGHFRHESGHCLIRDSEWLPRFRDRFGDERADYAEALQRHYDNGSSADWRLTHVTAYASVYPWEDWAETWAHYLHMIDSVETAATCGLALRPKRANEPSLTVTLKQFDRMLDGWYALAY